LNDFNAFPEVDFFLDMEGNPTISSPNSCYQIAFYQTQESLMDTEVYKQFLKNSIQRFRHSVTYKHYKGFLMEMGLNRCQFMSNITTDLNADSKSKRDAITLEMHHSILTIYDIGYMICEHTLKTQGKINSFKLSELIRQEHILHNVPLCFLSLTPHQLYHNDDNFYISPKMVFGNWYDFINKYYMGISQDIAFKIIFYLKRCMDEDGLSNDNKLLDLRNKIMDWSNCGAVVNF